MIKSLFKELGLTTNEIKVYLTLLKTGETQAGKITEASGIHRRNVYDSIERLIQKGLVSYVLINRKKFFKATEPERLLTILDERKQMLDKKRQQIVDLIPKLEALEQHPELEVSFFKGVEGIKTIFEDIVRTGKDYVGYGPGGQIEKILKYYLNHYMEEMTKKKMKRRLIYNELSKKTGFVKYPNEVIKFLPEKFSSHAALRIFGNKTAILFLSEQLPVGILINNKGIADGYRKYFEALWETASD
ncbi:TPA: hypothetical protein HA246_03000 [Candidatus Woesearchaeota archaeon]|nr:hypothetical protein [Candidatus Woesearchaeota archaeon]